MSGLLRIICVCCVLISIHGSALAEEPSEGAGYDFASAGTRQFEWQTEAGPAWIKVLVEEANLGSAGAEIIEIFFPPDYESPSHFHELEILYVIEGKLGHIVNGEAHVLTPGMVGIVRFPQEVVHKTLSKNGARVLVIWPLGNEVKGLQGMPETPIE